MRLNYLQKTSLLVLCMLLFICSETLAQDNAQRLEFENIAGLRTVYTEHFEIVYRPRFEWAVKDVAYEAEVSYKKLDSVFGTFPESKITLHIVDSADGPINQTLTAPQPFIRIWVAPPSDANGYGHLRLSNRFRLLIAHELVHLAMGSWHDQSGNIFGQVRSTTNEPMTFPFALLTQSKRFAPLWFHEGAAVFLETWLTNGQGRIMGNLDEAYFRTMALHNADIPNWRTVDATKVDEAFNINGSYFYGARFMAWLAKTNGSKKVVQWLREYQGASISSPFGSHYKRIFKNSLSADWQAFFTQEYRFQRKNIAKIVATEASNSSVHNSNTYGSKVGGVTGLVSKTYTDPLSGDVFFIEVPLHELPRLVRLNPVTGKTKIYARGNVGSPAFVNVAVTAFDHERRLFYFSLDTTVGWRDLYQIDLTTGEVTKVTENLRQTNLAVDPTTGDLWGTILLRGESHLARLKRPFSSVELFAKLPHNVSIRDFSFRPDGKRIAAVLQNHDQTQIVLIDPEALAQGGSLSFTSIAKYQDPENPTWSSDGEKLYFSSYANGISNVFRHEVDAKKTFAVSNVTDGLYKPTVLLNQEDSEANSDSVLAFQLLAGEGFQPVRIPTEKNYSLSKISYLGESVMESFAELERSTIVGKNDRIDQSNYALDIDSVLKSSKPFKYNGFNNIRLNTLVPIIGQSSTGESAFGLYTEASDVLNHHRLNLSLATSNDFDELYWDLSYLHKDTYTFNISKNRASLYALVNDPDPAPDSWSASISRRFWRQSDEAGRKIFNLGIGYNDNLENVFVNANYNSNNSRSSITGRRGIEKGWAFGADSNLFLDVGRNGAQKSDPSATVSVNARISDTFFAPHNRLGLIFNAGTSIGGDAVGFQINGFPNQTFDSRGPGQYRNAAVLPGLDSDGNGALIAKRFARVQVDNNFPVVRLYKALGSQRADLLDLRMFGTALFSDARNTNRPEVELDALYSMGAQVDIRLKHFFNLNSTLSFGYAKVWDENLDSYDNHGFISWNWHSF